MSELIKYSVEEDAYNWLNENPGLARIFGGIVLFLISGGMIYGGVKEHIENKNEQVLEDNSTYASRQGEE